MGVPPGSDGASSIQVTVRVRPFTIREAAQLTKSDDGPLFLGDGSLAAVPTPQLKQRGLRSVIKVMDERCLVFDPPEDNPVQRFSRSVVPSGKRVKDQTFGFDRVFDDNTTQADVYEATTKNLLDSVLDGYNATVFAYGATGCGKTHTITGTAQQPGIIFLTMQELFEKVDEVQAEKESEITLSYLEIYNEQIRDLLNPGTGGKQGLMLREDANQAVSVAGLSSHKPANVQEVMDMVIRGNGNRTQSPTEANATSSRSHAVLQVNISLKDRNASVNEPVTMATLSIIDLAGSERASATKNRGERLLEGANINKSLLALGSCINALCDPRKKNHVPYRNSKLTRLLKFSLGGNCRTVMIVCVSPSSQHFDETQNTLRYANRAKNIQTKSVRNVYNVDRHVKDYLKKIDEQMERIKELTAQQKQFEELAFVKFRKAEAKRAEIAAEGVARLRLAYEHCGEERRERIGNMRRLRQIERRIGAMSGWIGAFDQVCETREDEDPPPALLSMRKTAQGILVELEGSRQHFHQRLNRSNWTRAIDTALSDGLRQLQSLDGAVTDSTEESCLRKEAEMLLSRADVEAHLSVLDTEKSAESGLMQVLLTAHFETVAILNQILQMSEEEAIAAAKGVLSKLLQSCTEATGQVIKPDGGLQITEAVPPSKSGTPRKRKQVPLMGPSPTKSKVRQSLAGATAAASAPPPNALPPHMAAEAGPRSSPRESMVPGSSPVRPMQSPRRRVKMGGARKGVAFAAPAAGTPQKKKSPGKKRAVRWRDDEGEGAPLVEFQATPVKTYYSPPAPAPVSSEAVEGVGAPGVDSSFDGLPTAAPPVLREGLEDEPGSSPLPAVPIPSSEARKSTGTGRFAAGFLSKKNDGSPAPAPPTLNPAAFTTSSEDESASPLRDVSGNSAGRPTAAMPPPTSRPSSNKENTTHAPNPVDDDASASSGSDIERSLLADKETAGKIRSALKPKKRISSSSHHYHPSATYGPTNTAARQASRESAAHRRRSPTASASARDSPPPNPSAAASETGPATGNGIFSASHARRMVSRNHLDDPARGVLSPRSQAVGKGSSSVSGAVPAAAVAGLAHRRSMMDLGGQQHQQHGTPGQGSRAGGSVRVSSVAAGGHRPSSSLGGGKAAWR